MTKDEALDLALEALEFFKGLALSIEEIERAEEAITAIKQVRSAPVQKPVAWVEYETGNHTKRPPNCGTSYCSCIECVMEPAPVQEPVAWTVSGKITDWSKDFSAYQTKHYTRPVYTPPAAQRQWVGLTTEDMATCINEPAWDLVLRKADQILKEKNT